MASAVFDDPNLVSFAGMAADTALLGAADATATVMVDLDDTIAEVHGYQKGTAFGYSGVRGLNVILATVSTDTVAPVVVA